MSMTTDVKDELSRVMITKMSARKAEVATVLRFAGGLHIARGRVAVEAELDSEAITRRVCTEIGELYGHRVHVRMLATSGIGKGICYVVRVTAGGDALARQTGLLDLRGRPVLGLPAQIVAGSVSDTEGVWRGALLAAGSLTEPGRPTSLEIVCPGPQVALALVGAARRLGVTAKSREFHGVHQVVVRDGDAVTALLTRLGARSSALTWGGGRIRREVRAAANRLANFDYANQLRAARAAAVAAARVKRALEILAADVPDHLAEAGKLRMEHAQASLEQLAQLTNPPMTKDAIAGRIRRLLTMADKRAGEDGIPNTESGIPPTC